MSAKENGSVVRAASICVFGALMSRGLLGQLGAPPVPLVPALTFDPVRIDQQLGTVSFPAVINQRRDVVEYAAVTTSGNTPENFICAGAQPIHLHLAMLLLGGQPAETNFFPTDLSVPPPGEPVTMKISWRKDNDENRRACEGCPVAGNDHHPATVGPWISNGASCVCRTFLTQLDDSISSVHIDPDALMNNPRPRQEDDDFHKLNSAALPSEDLWLEITLHLPLRSTIPKSL